MPKNLKAITRVAKRYFKSSGFRARFHFASFIQKSTMINESQILFQSFDGASFGGNPFYMLKEMCENSQYEKFDKYIAVSKHKVEETRVLLDKHGFSGCTILSMHSRAYCKALAESKYLVNNSTFPTYFIKRPDQVYLNTWHGTPLKTMGRKMADRPHATGNTQRNLLMSDYLLYSNEYSLEHFRSDYMIGPYYSGQYVLSGYPCNSIFYDERHREKTKQELDVQDKRIVVYMPTWRQTQKGGHSQKHSKMTQFILMNLDEYLDEDIVVYAKPHYYDSYDMIDFDSFSRIRSFPEGYETYEILNIADSLLTDYSSVMFDFLNKNREIFLLTYDEEEYFSSRGAYLDLDELPFYRSKDVYDICQKLNKCGSSTSDIAQYEDCRSKFCLYDNANAASVLCDLLTRGNLDGVKTISGHFYHEDKPNILIFGGSLSKNGLTTSLSGLLSSVDLLRSNYLLTFYSKKGAKAKEYLNALPFELGYLPIQGAQVLTYSEAVARFLYYRMNIDSSWVRGKMESIYMREASRVFPGMKFDSAIHFTGYERNLVHLLLGANVKKRIIYVHNDMVRERLTKKNYHELSISRAYREFDKIAVVRESLAQVISDNFHVDSEKISVVHNINLIENIREKSDAPLSYDDSTESNIDICDLQLVLNDHTRIKFIAIARFSYEKGLDRLVDAFNRYHKENEKSVLVIVGGYGKEYKQILEQAGVFSESGIAVIKNISNPYPILKGCDVFVLPSRYEGLPMSIMEALILHKPVVSTAISGPKEFLEQGYGYLVDDSEDGVFQGLCAYDAGLLDNLKKFDAQEFNNEALEELKELVGE